MDKLQDGNVSAPNGTLNRRSFLEKGAYQHLQQGELKVLVPVALGVISVLGFIANATAVGVLVGNARKSKLSLINALILNLLVADGLLLAFAVPFKATAYSREGWTLGLVVCKTCDWLVHSCMAAKSLTVAIMAKACYRYVSNPTKQVTIRLKTIVVVLLFTWLLACVLPLPHWLFTSLQKEDGGQLCVLEVPPEAREFMSFYVKAYPLVAFCAPLSFALLYFWRAYGRCQRRCSKTQNLRAQIRSRKLTLMLFGLTVAMATMWLPHWVAWVWMRHAADSDGPVPPVLFTVAAQFVMFAISLANPLIVLALSEEFREGYKGLWRRLTLRKHAPKQQPKPGPHAPTAPRSPTPRPEASAHLPPRNTDESRADKQQQQQQEEEESSGNGNKDGVVPPDVEQFWNEREGGSMSHENDPVPWEHQDPKEGKQ
ncbi:G-protein coupled receptor 151 [Pangasianodon hypophthalmus]|uniref:G-protein coupled receptor 151 n=1 Tax=Pangasianodon hypophthalmus TaxID=310915 RepID=UPI000F00110D|nr:G-protein coupled receptor 151 [Pangasianodon hypophthalmus]